MRTMRSHAGSAVMAVLLIAGCGGVRPTPEVQRYVLAVAPPARTPLPGRVRVVPFSVAEAYEGRALVYRPSAHRLEHYAYHRWAARPRAVVTEAVEGYLGTRGEGPIGAVPLDVGGHILRLAEIDGEQGWSGGLAVKFRAERGGRLLFEKTYEAIEAAERRHPEAVVAALSRALERVLEEFVSDLSPILVARGG